MSGSSSGLPPLGPSNYGLLGQLIADSTNVQNRITTLTEQASSGLVSNNFAGLGSGVQPSLNLSNEIAQQNSVISGITAADNTISTTQSAMNQVSSIASNLAASLDNLTATSVGTVATQAQASLQQLAQLLDTQVGGNYIFAGQDSANQPVPNPGNILNSGFYTQINTAVGGLAANGAATTAASTLAVASSNAAGTSPFSAALSQPAAALANQRSIVELGAGQSAQIGILASTNAYATSSGSSTTGSYIRDLMRALATVGSLTGSQYNATGFQGLIQDTRTSLQGAISAMSADEGGLGATQNSVDQTGSVLSSTVTALTTQLSSIQNVNMASTLSNLMEVQTQLQASYKLIAGMTNLSLVQYVS